MTKDGERAYFTAQGIGKFTGQGIASIWRGSFFIRHNFKNKRTSTVSLLYMKPKWMITEICVVSSGNGGK